MLGTERGQGNLEEGKRGRKGKEKLPRKEKGAKRKIKELFLSK